MGIKLDKKTNTWVVWYVRRHPETKKPYSMKRKGIKTKAQAKKAERKLIALVERKFHEVVSPNWATVLEEFSDSQRQAGLMEKTVENYSYCLQAYTMPEWENRPVDKITGDEIRQLILEKLARKSGTHKKSVLRFIRSALNLALEKGYINRNPAPTMHFRMGDKIRKVLTEDQVKTFLEKAKLFNSEWYPIWAAAVYTGMRNGELYALTWDKVNLKNRQILVNCAWNNKDGFKSTKSGDDRIVEIAPPLLTMFQQLKLESTEPSGFVLPRIYRWDQGDQARQLRMFLMGIGIPPVRFHDLRATWATLLLSKGAEPIKVMKVGGWQNIKTMMIYIRKAGIDIRGVTDCLLLHNPSIKTAKVLRFSDEK